MIAFDDEGYWHGDVAQDLVTYLQYVTAGQQAIIKQATCRGCGGTSFRLLADPALRGGGGAAQRVCLDCGRRAFLADSQELWPLAKAQTGACPVCAGETFTLAMAFVMAADAAADVQWVYVGARCVQCQVLLSPLDWEIDYRPSAFVMQHV
jgi:hypothetical protein